MGIDSSFRFQVSGFKFQMLRFFRSSKSIVIVTVLLIGILTWLQALLGGQEVAVSYRYDTFLFNALNEWLSRIDGLSVWFGLCLFLIVAVMLVLVNNRLRLIGKVSYLPALCYVLLIGGMSEIHLFNPVVIAVILLMAGLILLVDSFESEQLSYRFFTVPALISLSTFFYQYMYFYMIVVWLVIALWRPGYWREWVFSILGFALPIFFAFSWFFLVEDDATRMGTFFCEILDIQRYNPSLSNSNIVFFALIFVLVIISFLYTLQYISSKKTVVRTGYYVLFIIVAITAGMIFAIPDIIPFAWYLLAFPLSIFISCFLANVKSKLWGNVVLAILFIGVIVGLLSVMQASAL